MVIPTTLRLCHILPLIICALAVLMHGPALRLFPHDFSDTVIFAHVLICHMASYMADSTGCHVL